MNSALSLIDEPSRHTPVAQYADVIVCGAGPAGIGAALSAARQGSSVVLLETHGCLGGVWTAGALTWIIDSAGKSGIMAEINRDLDVDGHRKFRMPGAGNFAYDVEAMKLLLERKCVEAGVTIRLHTRVVAALRSSENPNRVSAVITESPSGREAWTGRVFIDTTGDGTLGALSGCGFDYGHPETGLAQPLSLMALVAGIQFSAAEPFIGGAPCGAKERFLAEMERSSVTPSYNAPTLFQIRDGLFGLMANHQYGVAPWDGSGLTAATIEAREELHRLVDALRTVGGVWSDLRIVATAEQIGIREGRRLHGLYTVTQQDMAEGKRWDDAVCHVTFGVDVHSPDPKVSKGFDHGTAKSQPYDIPMRALIARDVENLLMAGRCISGDFWAHSSYRVTGNAVAMGEAAGTAANQMARRDVAGAKLGWPLLA